MQDLRAFNRQLVGDDYGVAGPYGYGLGAERGYTGMMATPMGQMRTAMRTAQMFAGHGLEEPCQAVLEGMRTMRQRYEEVRGQADMDAAEIADWRTNWLEKAVPVEELRGTMALTYVVGADVRNLQDEDLGNIETTLVDPDSGEIRYALISRGGFLGIGEEVVPVPWDRLKVTPLPFRDTFVLDVSEDTVEEAPSYEDDDLTAADIGQKVDDYWARALGQG